MARIKPFCAIRPNPQYADQLVLAKPQAQSVAGNNLPPLKDLLETPARHRPETLEGQAESFAEVNNTFKTLLGNGQLIRDEKPGIYVYEVETTQHKQTGIWALTELADYTDGTIKTHELTLGDSVRRLKNYREHTGLEGSPVLLAYPPQNAIERIIAQAKRGTHTTLGNNLGIHRLWKIEDINIQNQLITAFAEIETVYLADGHHRLSSAEQLLQERPGYDTLSALYMSTEELRIQEYNRVVIPNQIIEKEALLKRLMEHFYLYQPMASQIVQPRENHQFGLYCDGAWYRMVAKPHVGTDTDPELLQNLVLAPVFGITDPKNDQRLKCAGGGKALDEIALLISGHPEAIVFMLCPLTVTELMQVADANKILPPKSTWIDPKVPYGLLLNQHQSTI